MQDSYESLNSDEEFVYCYCQVEQQQPVVVDQSVVSNTSVQSVDAGQESPEKQRKKHKVCINNIIFVHINGIVLVLHTQIIKYIF